VREALPAPLRGVATFGYYTGWRRGEVLTLKWSNADRERQVITLDVGTTKNNEGRTLPYGLLPELVDVIDTAWTEHERLLEAGTICPYVFHRNGKRSATFARCGRTPAWRRNVRIGSCTIFAVRRRAI
jgi:integrase